VLIPLTAIIAVLVDYNNRAKELVKVNQSLASSMDDLDFATGTNLEDSDNPEAVKRRADLNTQTRLKELAEFIRINQSKFDEIQRLGESEIEAVQRQYAERITLLQERIRLEVGYEEEGQRRMVQAREDAQLKIKEIEARTKREEQQRQEDNLGKVKQGKAFEIDATKVTEKEKNKLIFAAGESLLEQAATQSKKAFDAYKALQVAKAVVAGYQAALANFEFGSSIGGFPVGLLFAAASVAITASQINAIKGQQYSGRRFGGGVTGNTPYIVGENGPEVMVPGKTGTVVPNGQAFGGQQAVNVNFNITTIDAKDFDTLLRARQGVIIGVINQALNEKGRRALV
jgi:hypothetical protein